MRIKRADNLHLSVHLACGSPFFLCFLSSVKASRREIFGICRCREVDAETAANGAEGGVTLCASFISKIFVEATLKGGKGWRCDDNRVVACGGESGLGNELCLVISVGGGSGWARDCLIQPDLLELCIYICK